MNAMDDTPGDAEFSKNGRGSYNVKFGIRWTKVFTCTQILLIMALILTHTTAQSTTPPPTESTADRITDPRQHYLLFDQVGHMASSTTYIHTVIPINISSVMAQAQPLFDTFTKLQKLKSKNLTHIPFCKNMYEIGKLFEERMFTQLKALKKIDGILPQDSPTSTHTVNKRVPFLPAIFRLATAPWFINTFLILKRVLPWATAATVIGTSAHFVSQSNRQEQMVLEALEEQRSRNAELNDLIKEYQVQLDQEPVRSPVKPETDNLMSENLQMIQKLNDTLYQAKNLLPPQYAAHYNFDQIVPLPPPRGWESHPVLIKTYTSELRNAQQELQSQINSLKDSPYVVKPPIYRLKKSADPSNSFDDFMYFFLSLTAWDHQPFEIPDPQNGNSDEFVSRTDSLSRQPRNAIINWGALATVVSGTFLGLYSTIESGLLRARINSLEHANNLLVHLSHRNTKTNREIINNLEQFLHTIDSILIHDAGVLQAQLDRIMTQWELQIRTVLDAVQQAQHHRLAINLLDPDQLQLLHQATLDLAAKNNYQVLPQQLSDYFQLEVSYARSGPDVLLIVHVPCVSTDQLMTIYKFIPFPIPLPGSPTISQLTIQDSLFPTQTLQDNQLPQIPIDTYSNLTEALFIDLPSDMIAINRDQQYRILNQADLAGCLKKNHVFICEKTSVLKTDLGDTCLGALYFRSMVGVQSQCKFDRRPLKEEVYQLSPFSFLVFTPEPYNAQIECRNGNHTPVFLGRMTKLTIPPHCHLPLRSHFIQPTEHFMLNTKTVLSEWSWNPLHLPAYLLPQTPHVDLALNRISDSLRTVKSELRSVRTDSQSSYLQTQADLKQLSIDATLDSEFETLLIKQAKTLSTSAIFLWVCFSLAVLGCLGSFAFYVYHWCTIRKYPSLVEALESMQTLLPSEEAQEPFIRPSRAPVLGTTA